MKLELNIWLAQITTLIVQELFGYTGKKNEWRIFHSFFVYIYLLTTARIYGIIEVSRGQHHTDISTQACASGLMSPLSAGSQSRRGEIHTYR
jgi:predicted ferric reductase